MPRHKDTSDSLHLYTAASHAVASLFIGRYSTSFNSAARLLPRESRQAIADIYGLVRVADEIVDTYRGEEAATLLEELRCDCLRAVKVGFSSNPIVQAFAVTAREYCFSPEEIEAFFASMKFDLNPPRGRPFTKNEYQSYIYGSAEVVGLMCLHVFCKDDPSQLQTLSGGARALGAAFQKINFLRDVAYDRGVLDRYYFPHKTTAFDESLKNEVLEDIHQDLAVAQHAARQLPSSSRPAVMAAHNYFAALAQRISKTPASVLLEKRVRINNYRKATLLTKAYIKHSVMRKNQKRGGRSDA